MSSLGQNILMALTVTVNKFASSNVQAVRGRERKRVPVCADETGRRGLFVSTSVLALVSQVGDSRTQLLEKYLKKSEENKARNDKERLESYYKRNYRDYFEFVEGSISGKNEQQLSESEKRILEWLKSNK